MSSFNDSSFALPANDFVPTTDSTRSFNDDGYSQQQFDSFAHSHFTETEHYSAGDSLILNDDDSFTAGDDIFVSQKYNLHSIPVHEMGGGLSPRQEMNGIDEGFGEADVPVMPPPSDILREENLALREWRRENAIRIEEKEKKEKELLSQIIEEADKYKVDFYCRREITCENNKESNREKEKVFLANQVKFHADADKNYWNTIADLIPNEVPALEKKKGKKEQEGKPSITIVQGPKPGKPTDLTRMRHLLLKLKHSAPLHLTPSPQSALTTHEDSGANTSTVGSSKTSANSVGAVAVA